jgi:sulfur-oxidizing protein SoxX
MPKRISVALLGVMALLVSGCDTGPHAAAGFRLPPGGSPERGKADFVAFGCDTCHEVSGLALPKPTVQPPVPVLLGGPVDSPMTDGYLVTSIIYPSYRLAGHPTSQIAVKGESRMPHDYAAKMTVQQLTDIVAFLQAQYVVRRTLPDYGYR